MFAPGADNSVSLGGNGLRWSQVWAGTATVNTSDQRVKSDQKPIVDGLATLMRLHPKTYFKHANHLANGRIVIEKDGAPEAGFVAQEVYEVLPITVSRPEDDSKGLWGLRYEGLLPYTVSAVQELKTGNDALKAENEALKAEVKAVKAGMADLEARLNALLKALGR